MIFKKACSRIESKPRLFQDRRGRRSLQKVYIVGATIGRSPDHTQMQNGRFVNRPYEIRIQKLPNFALGQMMILSETRKFVLQLFSITYRKKRSSTYDRDR